MIIKIVNWKKFNPRSDAKHLVWFRFQRNFFEDDSFYGFSHVDRLVWISLCCLACEKLSSTEDSIKQDEKTEFSIKIPYIATQLSVSPNEIAKSLSKIVREELIEVLDGQELLQKLDRDVECVRSDTIDHPCTTNERNGTNERNETDITNERDETGYDGHFSECLNSEQKSESPKKLAKPKSDPKPDTSSSQVWQSYSDAYEARYLVRPVRNAKVNAQCSQLVARLGVEDAVRVVSFYLTHNSAWYVKTSHGLGNCLKDAEGLRTQMLTDHRVSDSEARHTDTQEANRQTFAAVHRKLVAEGLVDENGFTGKVPQL